VSQPTRAEFQRLLASGELFEEYARMQRELAEIAQEMAYPIAQLRHAYQQMQPSGLANRLIAPQIARLEGLTSRLHRLQQGEDPNGR
jgi:hypothetical protein